MAKLLSLSKLLTVRSLLTPRKLPHRSEMIVAVAVGDGERKERAAALKGLMMSMTQVPQLQQFLQPQNAYPLGCSTVWIYGRVRCWELLDSSRPDSTTTTRPNPTAYYQQLQERIKQIGVQTQKLISDVNNEDRKSEFEQQKAADEMTLKMQESRSNVDMNAEKMALERCKTGFEETVLLLRRKIELKRQEMLMEAQIEARQTRPVSIGR